MRKQKRTPEKRKGKQMKNKMTKWWILLIVAIPFILMFCLHIGIALGNYFGININVPNVDASTWFTFASSYLGGSMTLFGVMFTIHYERSVKRYEEELKNIETEKDQLGKAICELNIFAPGILYQQFNSLEIMPNGYNSTEVASIWQRIVEEKQKINKQKLEVMYFTDMYTMTLGCSACKNPCRIQTILPEFQKLYETVGISIFNVLDKIGSYIAACEKNATLKALINNCQQCNQLSQSQGQTPHYEEATIIGYEKEIVDVKPIQDDVFAAIIEVSNYNNKEIQQLLALAREYIAVKQQNANKKCFPNKEK